MNLNRLQKIVCVIALCLAIMPLLGFPSGWENFFMITGGLSIIFLTVRSARHKKTLGERVFEEVKSIASQVFVEHNPTENL